MRTTLTSIIALGFAVTSTTAVLADDTDDDDVTMEFGADQERFTDAGFEGARVMQNVEVARVTKDGETFYVVHGIGNGAGMDQAGMQPGQPGQQAGQLGQAGDTQAGALGQPGEQQAGELGQPGAQDDLAADDPLDQQPGAQAGQPGAAQPGELGQPGAQDDLAADDPLDQQPGAQDDLAADDPLDQQPGAQAGQPGAAQPGGQPGAAGMDQPGGMAAHRSLEDLLEEAGIEDYEILDDVSVASTRLGDGMDGQEVYVVYGIEDAEGDS
jgi:hypothetical protein